MNKSTLNFFQNEYEKFLKTGEDTQLKILANHIMLMDEDYVEYCQELGQIPEPNEDDYWSINEAVV